ncbi:MAG: AAA family ATPase [Candidatus Tenebribacter burtonii]|jgi:predicted ATP-dependent endonuclease of OLD family|nr:AAA family ATPase [Candidatus Tenebribacter burtonii]
MELVFMWVREYNPLKNIGFNFGGEHLFRVKRKEIKRDKYKIFYEIEIAKGKNPHNTENFFNENNKKTNILNITAIIGKNGSGKSTILEVIHKIGPKLKDAFFILRDGNKYYHTELIDTYDQHKDNYVINKATFKKLKIEPVTNELPSVIFYSNVFQPSTFKYSTEKSPLDISTMKYLYEGKNKTKPLETVLSEYNLEELNRQMNFVGHYDTIISKDFGFEMPTQITILESHLFITHENKIDEDKIKLFLNTDEIIKTRLLKFILKIDFSDLFNASSDYRNLPSPSNLHRIMRNIFILRFINILNSENRNLKKSILASMDATNDFSNFLNKSENKLILDICEMLLTIAYNFHKNTKPMSQTSTKNIFGNFKEDKDNITELVRLLESTDYTSNLLQFKWRDMSSGEMAILTLFSRFHSIRKELEVKNDLLILMDEPDMYLHPSWIQKFISIFLKYLNSDFPDKNLQIILTSNKPICTSDLPANNVIRLNITDYDKDNWPIIEVMKNDLQPFGANIYSLYKDGFFLNEGFIGMFAKNKIQEVIKWLNDENNFENENTIKKVIKIIGEPVLREKLKMMFNNKMEKHNDKNSSGK